MGSYSIFRLVDMFSRLDSSHKHNGGLFSQKISDFMSSLCNIKIELVPSLYRAL